ncbi:hypothetical protein HMPREF1870_02793, partial [Bacteroidales bacterium KA00344]
KEIYSEIEVLSQPNKTLHPPIGETAWSVFRWLQTTTEDKFRKH